MRSLLLLTALTACSADNSATTDTTPSSLRERLETAPTRMVVSPVASFGSVAVKHYVDGAWETSRVTLPLDSGAVTTTLDDTGHVVITELGLGFQTIALPIANDATLTQVRLDLAAPITTTTTWNDENDAAATASLPLGLAWTLTVDGVGTPLGDQKLPALPLQLELGGDGAEVDGSVLITAPGKLWSWADLIEFDDLSLTLQATSTD
jgi:hypothetical protein